MRGNICEIVFRVFQCVHARAHLWLSGKFRRRANVTATMASDRETQWVAQVLERLVGAPGGPFAIDSVTCWGEGQSDGSTARVVRITWRVNIERPPGVLTLRTRVTGAEWFPFVDRRAEDGTGPPSGPLWNDDRREGEARRAARRAAGSTDFRSRSPTTQDTQWR